MNNRGELQLRDFVSIFLIYILLMTTIATSSNISIQENESIQIQDRAEEVQSSQRQENKTESDLEKENSNTTNEKNESAEIEIIEENSFQSNETSSDKTKTKNNESENTTIYYEENKSSTNKSSTNKSSTNKSNETESLSEIPQNQSNNTLSKQQTTQNQTNQTTEIPQNQTNQTIKEELVQHEAIINKPVLWTKKIYTNNPNLETKIPKEATQLNKTFKQKPRQSGFSVSESEDPYIEIIYETESPKTKEKNTQNGKEILVYSKTHYENVTVQTNLSESLKVKDPSKIQIKWLEENQIITPNSIQDKDQNGIYDFVEWQAPHLSNQTFQIIILTKASHLDQNKSFLSDIYNEVSSLDQVYSPTIFPGEFARITFEKNLSKGNDITIYPKIISGDPKVEVYEKDSDQKIAEFKNLHEGQNKIYLIGLISTQDTFDLKIIEGSLQFDYIIDPTVSCGADCNLCNMPGSPATDTCDTGSVAACAGVGGDGTDGYFFTQDIWVNGSFMAGDPITIIAQLDSEYTGAYYVTGWQGDTKMNEFGCYDGTDSYSDCDVGSYTNTLNFNNNRCNMTFGSGYWGSESGNFGTDSTINISTNTSEPYHIRVSFSYQVDCATAGQGNGFGDTDGDFCQEGDFGENDGINITVIPANEPPTTPTGIQCNGQSCDSASANQQAQINCSGSTDPENDLITYVINSSLGSVGNHTNSSTATWDTSALSETQAINFTCYAIDLTGSNSPSSNLVVQTTMSIDHTSPILNFSTGTPSEGSSQNSYSFYVNTSLNETNFANITFNVYDSSHSLVKTKTYTTQTLEHTFTDLASGLFFYNATTFDKAGNNDSTTTRNITLDRNNPSGTATSPSSGSHSNSATQNLTVNASDSLGLKEAILYIFNSTNDLINTTSVPISGTFAVVGIIYTFLADGVYKWFYKILDQADNSYNTPNQTITIDTTPSVISLESVPNNSGDNDGNLIFNYNITDVTSNILNCSLILNEITDQTSASITKGAIESFTKNSLSAGRYNWSIRCFDESENEANSQTRFFDVILSSLFDGATTDLSAVNTSNITDFTIENQAYGKIKFNEQINLSGGVDLDNLIIISQESIYVNSTAEPRLNKSATITFYNLNYQFTPVILKDNSICQNCYINSYSSGNLSFNITSFSNYTSTNNSALEIYDETDSSSKYQNDDVKFFANYSNSTTGQPITGAGVLCNITFSGSESQMTYNATSNFYEHNRSFSNYGIENYEVNCYGSTQGYENLTLQDSAIISYGSSSGSSTATGYKTQAGVYNFAGTDEFIPLNYPIQDLDHAFVLAPNQMNQEDVPDAIGGDAPIDSDGSLASLYLYNTTHIRIQRDSSTDGAIVVTWQVLEAADQEFTVQRGSHSFTGSGATTATTIPTAVNPTNSMSWFYASTDYNNDYGDINQFYANITNSTGLTFTRTSTGTSTTFNFRWIVVEWDTTKISSFQKGYTGPITGAFSSPDCTPLDSSISKSSSLLIFNSHAISDEGLDASARAGYIQDNDNICFYDFNGPNTAGVKWFVIDFGESTNREEDTNMGEWSTTTYREDVTFTNTYDTNKTLFWISSVCDGDGAAKPRHTHWWNLSSSAFTVERNYGGQPRYFSWQVLELPYQENPDSPQFTNYSTNKSYAKENETIRFSVNVTDSDGINWTKGIINTTEYNFSNSSDIWYYDYTCTADGTIQFSYVSASDLGSPERSNSTSISGVSTICDTTSPQVTFQTPPTPTDLSSSNQSSFQVQVSIQETNFQKIVYELYNSSGLINQTNYTTQVSQITYQNLGAGDYSYNVTVYDLSGNKGSSETRTISIDSEAPVVTFVPNTKDSGLIVGTDEVYLNITVTESNEKGVTFKIYDQYGVAAKPIIERPPLTREITWTLLPDGLYFYNATVEDDFSNFGYTETRNITLDNSAPQIQYTSNSEANNTYFQRNWIYVQVNITEDYLDNTTFTLYNSTGIVDQTTFTDSTSEISWNSLSDGEYFYNVTSYDKAANSNSTSTRKITLDNQDPIVNFGTGTASPGATLSQSFVYINSSVTETNFQNITFYLYSDESLVNQTTFTGSTRQITFSNLASDTYYYNFTVYDKAKNYASSSTRSINLDTAGPVVTIVNPEPIAYGVDTGLALDTNIYDEFSSLDKCWWNIDDEANQSITCGTNTTFDTDNGQHTIKFFSNDSFGYVGYDSVTFLVSTGGPAVTLTSPENATVYSSATEILFNYSATDINGVDSCSLYGTWGSGWHLNETDLGSILIDGTNQTCGSVWGSDCGLQDDADNTFDTCQNHGTNTAFMWVNNIYINTTSVSSGDTVEVTCEFRPWDSGTEEYIWYYNGTGWTQIYSGSASASETLENVTVTFVANSTTGTHWVRCSEAWTGIPSTECQTGVNSDNDDINFTVDEKAPFGNFSKNISGEGSYLWNVECNDTTSNTGTAISNYTLILDYTNPIVDFGTNTLPNATLTNNNYIFVDANLTETNPDNITFHLYNQAKTQIDSDTYSNGRLNTTFTGLSSGIYYYNISAYDKSGRYGNSSTRQIQLDIDPPTGFLISPTDLYFTSNTTQNHTANATDSLELSSATLFIYNSTNGLTYNQTLDLSGTQSKIIGTQYIYQYDDVFDWFYQIIDSVGNQYNTTSNQIEIDSSSPVITFIPETSDDDAILNQDNIYLNVSIYEKNYKNLTFYLYNDEGQIYSNSYSDSTRQINWTTLADDTYYYNVTSYDLAKNKGSSETRTITLDTTAPIVNYAPSTPPNNSVITGSSIFINATVTDPNEKNITFKLYNATGSLYASSPTYTDHRRTYTFTFIPEGTYYYNVTVYDEVGLKGVSPTRKISLDNTNPIINFASPTESNFSNKSQTNIYINTSITETNFANLTFYLYNSSGLVSSNLYSNSTRSHNFTGLSQGIYYYNATVFDKASHSASTSTRTITLDTTKPTISFTTGTEANGSNFERDWVYVNVTAFDQYEKIIYFRIYDQYGLVSETSYTDQTREMNFTSLPSAVYYYNVTIEDWSGNTNTTETRLIGLDSAGPNINIINPKSKTYGYNESLPLEFTATDAVSSVDSCWWNIDAGTNQSITCGAPTTFNTSEGSHTIYAFANDTFGNVGSNSVTFYVSLTGPAVELIAPENNTFFSLATEVNFSFSAWDPDGVDTCSLYGDWGSGWHLNQSYSGTWQDVTFKHRKNITITNVGASTLTDFPVYLNLSSTGLESATYEDIRFFNGSCDQSVLSELSYEIEDYDSVSANVWIKIPSFSTGNNTICMYYASSNAESSENPADVWSGSYTSVYHLDHTSGTATDTLGNFNAEDGIDPDSNMDQQGAVGGADYFDGSDYLGTNPEWDVDGAHTYCSWVRFSTAHDGTILEDGGLTDGTGLGVTSAGEIRYAECYNNNFYPIDSGTTYDDDSWHYVCGGHTGSVQFLYIDGELASQVTQGDGVTGSNDARIGEANGANPVFDDNTAHNFIGYLDEIRVSSTSRSADWINQSYQQIVNQDTYVSFEEEENFTAFQVYIDEEGSYTWNIDCNDTTGDNSSALSDYSFIVDITNPQVFFGIGTEDNNSAVGRTWIYMDANVIENNFLNITFNLHNSTGYKWSASYTDSTRNHNFTNLPSGKYYYNITVYDRALRTGDSETRVITIDTDAPTGTLTGPANNTITNQVSQNYTASFSDTTGLVNATLYILNELGSVVYSELIGLGGVTSAIFGIVYAGLSEGIYYWFYSVEDSVGNTFNTTNFTLTIDLTDPTISFTTGTESSGKVVKKENIFANITSNDTYFSNVTFYLYDASGLVNPPGPVTYYNQNSSINWTGLPDKTYYYNVTAFDAAGNDHSTETRNITLDNLAPSITYSVVNPSNGAFKSGDTISVYVDVVEANEQNITFYLFDENASSVTNNTYTDYRRTVSWNLLPEGLYYYNVTVFDKVNQSDSTTTRSITLDDTSPGISYGFGTEANNTYFKRNWVYIKINTNEENFLNSSISLYNSTGLVGTQNFFTEYNNYYNWTGLPDGQYWYNATTYDKAKNSNKTTTRKITLDNSNPEIAFVAPTYPDNYNTTHNYVDMHVSTNETNFANITYYLYNSGGPLYNLTYTTYQSWANFTFQNSDVYWYNATVYDKAGNKNSTETRKIGLDYLGPSIAIINPKAKAYGYNVSLPLDYTVIDAIVGTDTCWYNIDDGSNTTVDCQGSATFNTTDGGHTLHFFANDTFGQTSYKNVTFLVSTTGPAIQLFLPEDNTFYSGATEVFFNYTAEDPDLTESCSLFGSWNGGWHLNQTDSDWLRSESSAQCGADCNLCNEGGSPLTDSCDAGNIADCGAEGTDGFFFTQDIWVNSTFVAGEEITIKAQLDSDFYGAYYVTGWQNGVKVNEFGCYDSTDSYSDCDVGSYSNLDFADNRCNMTFGSGYWGSEASNFGVDTTINSSIDPSQPYHIRVTFSLGVTVDAMTCAIAGQGNGNGETDGDFCEEGNYGENDGMDFTVYAPKTNGNFTLNLSEEGSHLWNVQCNDTLGYNTWAATNYSLAFDVTDPIINFTTGTLANDSNVSQNYIFANVTITENNFENLTFYLYDENHSLVDSHFYNDSTRSHNFTSLSDGTYYYNATTFDAASRSDSTETRKISLDKTSPTGNLISPADNTITNNATQNLTATFSDAVGLYQAILYIFNQTGLVDSFTIGLSGLTATIGYLYTFLSDGVYDWFYQVEDVTGNKYNLSNYTITIDTTPPIINFIPSTKPNATYIDADYIYLNVSITEDHFKNITYSLVGPSPATNTFTSLKTDINWTNRAEGNYKYNVTAWDTAGNKNTSETRQITLDRTNPIISYVSPTLPNYVNVSQSYIFVNTSITESNFANITFRLEGDSPVTYSDPSQIRSLNWTPLNDGTYTYNASTCDKAGHCVDLSTRTATLDTTPPQISFTSPTENSGSEVEQSYVFINTSIGETNFKNITFELYNSTTLINKTTYQAPISSINFSAESTNITYYYNVTAFDQAGNSNSTETRNITLIDTTPPTLSITSPTNKTYSYNESIRIAYQVSDIHLDSCWYNLNSGTNITIPGCTDVFIDVADEQTHLLKVFANDTMGYETSRNVTFSTNTSLVVIPETYSVQHGTVFTDGSSTASISEIDPSKAFILHTTRGSSHQPNNLQTTSDFPASDEIQFKNYAGGSGVVVSYAVIGGPNITVERGEISYTTESEVNLTINSVNLSNTFIVVNNRLNSSASSANAQGFWTAKFHNETIVTFERNISGTSGTLSYQIVEWEGSSVQSGNSVIQDSSTETQETISQINPNQTFLLASSTPSSTIVQNSMVASRISNSTSLEFNRTGTAGSVQVEWFLVENPIFNSQNGVYSHIVTSSVQYIQIPETLVNKSRSFSTHSNKNSGTSTLFANAFVTQGVYNITAVALQKGTGTASGTTAWETVEIAERDPPTINLTYPINTQNLSTYLVPYFNFTVSDESQIINCSLYGNWSGGWHLNQTISSPSKDTGVSFQSITTQGDGYYFWNVKCVDAYGNENWSSQNYTFATFLPPTEPTIYNITQTANDGTGNTTLSWAKSNHSTKYEILAGETFSSMTSIANTTLENYTDITFSAPRRFYKVIASNPISSNESEIFARHLYTLKHDGAKSENWIAFPTNFSYLTTADETRNEINSAVAITMFNETIQTRTTCNNFSCPSLLSCTPTNCNFNLEQGRGYEVSINTSGPSEINWSGVGETYYPMEINLVKNSTYFNVTENITYTGKNWIALWANTTLTSAQNLIESVPNIDATSRWNEADQDSEGRHFFPILGIYIGTNFQLNIEEGYEVSVTSSGTWTQE